MPQLPPKLLMPPPRDEQESSFQQALMSYVQKLVDIINGGLRFSDNFDAEFIEYTSNGSADTEDTVAHTLKRVPSGFILVNTDKAVSLYDSGTSWTATNLYLKANVASATVKILVF